MEDIKVYTHSMMAHPHQGACGACHDAKLCNYCGASIRQDRGRCTNGRCSKCHSVICTDGGATSPGHGFGKVGSDWRTAGRSEGQYPVCSICRRRHPDDDRHPCE